jgi:hypothetical protein
LDVGGESCVDRAIAICCIKRVTVAVGRDCCVHDGDRTWFVGVCGVTPTDHTAAASTSVAVRRPCYCLTGSLAILSIHY